MRRQRGKRELAAAVLHELEGESGRWTQPAVHALLNEARFLLADGVEAMRFLLLARQLWTSAGIEYHAARVRLDIARRLLAAGDEAGATVEIAAAEHSANRIGSPRLKTEVRQMHTRQNASAIQHS